jgi:hypothetical protein
MCGIKFLKGYKNLSPENRFFGQNFFWVHFYQGQMCIFEISTVQKDGFLIS